MLGKNIVHSPRELWKITRIKDGAIYSTRSLGLWYVPMGTNFKNDLITKAKELGGDEWGSPSTIWCKRHDKEIFRAFPVVGYYKIEEDDSEYSL